MPWTCRVRLGWVLTHVIGLQMGCAAGETIKQNPNLLTVPRGGQTQVFHPVFDELRKLLPFRPPVQTQSLLADPLGRLARVLVSFPAQPAGPLHAFAP